MDNGEGASCTHMQHIVPPWLSLERSEVARLLYKADQASFEREVQGRIASSYTYIFNKQLLRLFQNRPHYQFENPKRVRVIHVGVDPHGGGEASDFVIFSMCYIHGRKVVS